MFSAKTSAPATGGLSINTSTANSLFSNTSTSTTQPATAGLFGNQQKPTGSLFGNAGSTQTTGGGLFGGQGANTSSSTQQGGMASGGLFGNTAKPATPSSGLFGNTNTQQTGTTGGGLFGNTANTQQQNTAGGSSLFGGNQGTNTQTQTKSLFGTTPSTTGTGLFGNTQNATQQQQKPTLSIFGAQNTTTQQPQAAAAQGTVVQGVRIDASNLLPTTKFESCADEIKRTIEQIDTYILTQIKTCNEVADIIPTVASQGSTVPNDVEFVSGKLETIQLALENDARDIDAVRNMVARNAAEAQVAFRAIDNLKLPLQYQSTGGGWWSVSEQQLSERQTLRSSIRNRKSTLALPDGVEGDPSTADSINGIPTNLVEYFSHRSDEMSTVLDNYRKNLKEIEDHLHGVEGSLNRQINEFLSSRNRDDGAPGGGAKNQLADLAAALGDVEAGILGVASRLGGVKEEVQELILGPPTLGMGRLG
ncbi:nucleoporin NUP49/NSP49, putative [Talaromyces stipitatus ATCC 10500]|uniref:Nucleoporin NUP49/NSP49, putative n=1 Tax=Talaromyces stipitatus (strain ATCC 10500 / CBS 375.48 / QM 6759 / NRRL 1006) TaxID=441959 RepID=B8MRK7_TALSN|nr:nucleoporin NUP49/NSP49, putative [Talaromyces stipitatus ATCC 10500]EED13164.1 nucleoporin NUP49/NSP49, putative [Talaromyces stipitatus ATCC 10500]